ncbi:SE domain-containing protein [Mycena chlorophos]|uniref:Squalene monooxygenase n=1 Tax=Mycena chlorophos TaxID=658473 RepID=A0A8H6T5V9_MYCCL|nr:SE domain-containing protein [Mycena chlorophos]
MSQAPTYDVLIVGAGVAGCALAHALANAPRTTPLRIALLERTLAEPDRIVGELMQPGGVLALEKLGLAQVLEGIDAAPVEGYCVYDAARGKVVKIPYPGGHRGRAFHHGRLIMNLRAAAKKARGVEVIEASVTDLVEDKSSRVVGVKASIKGEEEKRTFSASLVVVADGCNSNFRGAVLGPAGKSTTKSHFIGVVLEDAVLPIPNHGTVCLIKGSGPAPVPADLKGHILKNIAPQLPQCTQPSVKRAIENDRLRKMPNSWLPSTPQGGSSAKPGVVLIGDSWNMRHPLTGGGMTVALNDVASLVPLLGAVENLGNWREVQGVLDRWFVARKPLASTINILSVALYDLFGADAPELEVLRTGCFKYFELGGECVNGPVSILSALAPSPALLTYHFFRVAFYAIWVMFTHPRAVPGDKTRLAVPSVAEYPFLLWRSIQVFYTACVVFGPLLWEEMIVHAMPSRMQLLMLLGGLYAGYTLLL